MKILRVGIKNINSLKLEESIDFSAPPLSETGLFAIVGDTGSGKTTLLDAITLGLYGKVARDASPGDVMSYGSTDSLAEVDFETSQGLFRSKWTIWRSRGKQDGKIQGPKRELSKWNKHKKEYEIIAEKIAEVNLKVEEVSGLDYVRFTKSVLLSQGDFAAFLKSKESERSDLLERITGTEIYSELSIAAHRKKREEEAVLSRLEMERDAQQLLAPEEVKTLKSDLKETESNHDKIKAELESKNRILNSIREAAKLRAEQKNLEHKKKQLDLEKGRAKPDFERLEFHKKVQPLRGELALYSESFERKTTLELQSNELITSQLEGQERLDSLSENLQTSQKELKEILARNKKEQRLFEEVIELDFRISELVKTSEESEKNHKKLTREKTIESERLESFKTLKKSIENQREKTSDWLVKNKKFGKLTEQLSSIHVIRRDLRDFWKVNKDLEEEKQGLSSKISDYEKRRDSAELKRKETEKNSALLSAELQKIIPEKYAATPTDLLNLINHEIEELNEQLGHIRQFMQLTSDYRSMLMEMDDNSSELADLQSQENRINNRLITALEMVDQLKGRLDYKQKIYEQQRMIAGYEEERRKLKKGDPCPLCFSTEHSLEAHDFEPFVNETREEYEAAKNQYEEVFKSYRILLNHQQEIYSKIDRLVGTENRDLNGQIQNQLNKILGFEERFSSISDKINPKLFLLSQEFLIKEKLEEIEITIVKRRTLRERISGYEMRLKKAEKEEKEIQNLVGELEKEGAVLSEKLKNLEARKETAKTEKERKVNELNELLKPFELSFDFDTAKEMFEELEGAKSKFELNTAALQNLDNKLIINEKDIKNSIDIVKKLDPDLVKIKKELERQNLTISNLKNKKSELFGDKDPRSERDIWNNNLTKKQELTDAQKHELEKLNLEIQTHKVNLENIKKQINLTKKSFAESERKLLVAASEIGIEKIELLQNGILSQEEHERLESLQKKLEKSTIEIENEEKSTVKKLEKFESEISLVSPGENFEKEVADLSELNENVLKNLGSIRQKLEHQKEVEKGLKSLIKNISEQKKSVAKWSRLSDLIGSSDGKKFRAFAQSLTLEKLARIANHHLQNLDGRYLIQKQPADNLELEIIDTYQADNIRSMNTLSGGETFLVSLSLALGLSNLAGRNTQIESLFIDEGFGTLDEATLDTAISSLENLQSTGKTIGVISHVSALKERIATQIRMVKKGNGFSEIQIV